MKRIARSTLAFCLLLGCTARIVDPERPAPTLTSAAGADDPGSCASCHPRQFREWAGSSHNYGAGIDPTYQALEITANYYGRYRSGRPGVRQNLFCIGCHAPSGAGYQGARTNPNATFRPPPQDGPPLAREIERPPDDADLLRPPGRATEEQVDPAAGEAELFKRRRVTYQGITCDICHKVPAPFDDLNDEEAGQACREATPECAAMLRAQCEAADDPRCRRISRGGRSTGEDRFERGISNLAILYEREGAVRYGPFSPLEELVATNTAHGLSAGEPLDGVPYLKTGQFCGACHDVRLSVDNPATPAVELEPITREPFMRLENLYSEWFVSPLNLHPDSDLRDNPYLDENGEPRRRVCQDCHMSLYPFAPPGTFPGAYTAGEDECDELGRCGLPIALDTVDGVPTTLAGLRVIRRPRVTTHNFTGVDIGLGLLPASAELLDVPPEARPSSLSLPNQTLPPERDADPSYGLPMSVDARRKQQLRQAAMISLAGTPEMLLAGDRDCSDGTCCDDAGDCNLAIKAWIMNVNGGHQIAAGFSQERQIWIELTVEDLGRIDPVTGLAPVVDCALGSLADLYGGQALEDGRHPRFQNPVPHDARGAADVFNRMDGVRSGTTASDRAAICRGLSGHLIDKPHHETGETAPDGSLDDEDLWLHRIGNTLPTFAGGETAVSWHVVDYGLDDDRGAAPDGSRVARADQFHVLGNNAFSCDLGRREPDPALADLPIVLLDPVTGSTSTVPRSALGPLEWRVTDTSDERLEILYPFPELRALMPRLDAGRLIPGERSGLVYPTNVFYRVCGCPRADGQTCEGPDSIPGVTDAPAQVPWLTTYPALPYLTSGGDDRFHFPGPASELGGVLSALGLSGGTAASEAFTFVPLNANHMPNNRALAFFKPQRHYWDLRVTTGDVVGPILVSAKLYYRHFPPEFLRLMARSSKQAYARAAALGEARDLFPNGPLVSEANLDRVERILMDEAAFLISVGPDQITVPDAPTFDDVRPILQDHCLPCHSDVLRHGGLVLGYDAFPEWDDPKIGPPVHAEQDPRLNLVERPSRFLPERTLVAPRDPDASFLLDVLMKDDPDPSGRVRRMPLKLDRLSAREIETIRRWIAAGATG